MAKNIPPAVERTTCMSVWKVTNRLMLETGWRSSLLQMCMFTSHKQLTAEVHIMFDYFKGVCIACYHGVYTDLSSCQNPHFLFCEQAGGRGEYWQLCVCTFGWLFSLRTSRSFRAWERRQLDSPSLLGISVKVCWSFRVQLRIRCRLESQSGNWLIDYSSS